MKRKPAPIWDRPRPHLWANESPWTPFRPLDTPYRLRKGREIGAQAGLCLALAYLASGLFTLTRGVSNPTLLGSDPQFIATIHFMLASAAGVLGVWIWKGKAAAPAVICLTWSILELFPFATLRLMGHATWPALALMSLALSILAIRVAAAKPPAPVDASPSSADPAS